MKVFMSWSGPRSHAVAKLLGDWLENVIQAVKPWISSAEIDRGELWFRKIGDTLAEVNIGIVCLTPENKDNPWIMFEAGALLKGLATSRVMTFLIDLKHQDVRDPLAQFNHTTPSEADLLALVQSLNAQLNENQLSEKRLLTGFQTYWPKFEAEYKAIMEKHVPEGRVAVRSKDEILSEVLETVRGIKRDMRTSRDQDTIAKRRYYVNSTGKKVLDEILKSYVEKSFRMGVGLSETIENAPINRGDDMASRNDFIAHIYGVFAADPRLAGVEPPPDFTDERR